MLIESWQFDLKSKVLAPAEIKAYSQTNILYSLYHILEIWLVIALAIYLSFNFFPISSGPLGLLFYGLVVLVVASRQHALMVLTHDGVHFRLAKNKRINDWLARLSVSFPIFISLAKWRVTHFYHHNYTYTNKDPDVAIFKRYPLLSRNFLFLMLKDFLGINVIQTLKYFIDIPLLTRSFNQRFLGKQRLAQYEKVKDIRAFYIFWAVVLALGVYFGSTSFLLNLILYWIVPYCTFTQVFFRIRGAIEHGNVPNPKEVYQQTRTYILNPILAFFFAPKSVNFHLEHHLYPSVPFFRLARLHHRLKESEYLGKQPYLEPFAVSLGKLVT